MQYASKTSCWLFRAPCVKKLLEAHCLNKIKALVLLPPDDEDAHYFLDLISLDPELHECVELIFARSEEAFSCIKQVEVVVCGNLSDELIADASVLRWIMFWSAGMDGKARPNLLERNIALTNASGVHGPNIAEHVLAWMLMFNRRMDFHYRMQIEGQWRREPEKNRREASELTGKTLGIVGLGRIGEALAKRAKAFDMRVVATKRDLSSRHEGNDVDELIPISKLPELLSQSDHICIALPYTPETHHLLNAHMLEHCKNGSFLYNIARGKIIDELALIQALKSGKLAGVGLDVFEQEPLQAESELWTLPNVLITPHTAGLTPLYFKRTAELFAANLKRYLKREPLENLYSVDKGY